ncbi:hypothetical protein AX15_006741 [Amanita polypyramis BW_CC]|nr:hypothetical protein AX15_006741 [Amanita polypyramis BW_CC]
MSRQRANTAAFPFHWRRPRPSVPSALASSNASSNLSVAGTGGGGADSSSSSSLHMPQPMTTDISDLISSLMPPAVPSLSYARVLASLLPAASPVPKRSALTPIWSSLCDPGGPTAIQAAGYDLIGAYFENEYREKLTTADRLSYFSLFTSGREWAVETWEPRLKALRGMTGFGSDILGIEEVIIELLKVWIQAAFDGLLVLEARSINGQEGILPPAQSHSQPFASERNERNERERCITLCAEFIAKILEKVENVARIPGEALDAIISFYGTLVDRAVQLPRTRGYDPASEEPDDAIPPQANSPSTTSTAGLPSMSKAQNHRRSASSSTSASGSTTIPTPSTGPTSFKHPAEIAINLYLSHLSSQAKILSPNHLQDIFPILFRATAFCTTPLSRLSVVAKHPGEKSQVTSSAPDGGDVAHNWKRENEEKICTFLGRLLSGPYSTLSKLIIKVWLGPPGTTPVISAPPPLFPIENAQLPFQPYSQMQQVQSSPVSGRSSQTDSLVPTQPATPVPPLISLPLPSSSLVHFSSPAPPSISSQTPSFLAPPPQVQSIPTSPIAHFVTPILPSISSQIPSFHPSSSPLPPSAQSGSSSSTGPGQTYLKPLVSTSETLFTIHTSLGAHRTIRTALRRSLVSRLARAYVYREASLGYAGGGPARVDVEWEAMERTMPSVGGVGGVGGLGGLSETVGFLREGGGVSKGHDWSIARIGRITKWAVRSWVEWEAAMDDDESGKEDEETQTLKEASERVLEEVAGVLKDLLQEVDERGEDNYSPAAYGGGSAGYAGTNPSGVAGSQMEEDESVAIGETLFELAGWLKRLREPNGGPYVPHLHPQHAAARPRLPHSLSHSLTLSRATPSSTPLTATFAPAPTSVPTSVGQSQPVSGASPKVGSPALIRTLTTLLSRSHFTTPLRPLLSLTLTSLSDHLTDADMAPLPDIMLRMHELSPTSLDWLENWKSVLGVGERDRSRTSKPVTEGGVDKGGIDGVSPEKGTRWMEEAIVERESGPLEYYPEEREDARADEYEYESGGGLIGLGSPLTRRKTREEVMVVLDRMYDSVRDMGAYRRALADVVYEFARRVVWWGADVTSLESGSIMGRTGGSESRDEFDNLWRLLADEVVLRTVEGCLVNEIRPFLELILSVAGDGGVAKVSATSKSSVSVALEVGGTEGAAVTVVGAGVGGGGGTLPASGLTSPVISRMQSEYAGTGVGTGTILMPSALATGTSIKDGKDGAVKESSSSGSGLISLLSSLAAGATSASITSSGAGVSTTMVADELSASPTVLPGTSNSFIVGAPDSSQGQVSTSFQPALSPEAVYTARSLSGVFALISTFSQLAFSPFVMEREGVRIVIRVYEALLSIAGGTGTIGQNAMIETRLAALTFLMRLRADSDHRVFFSRESYDENGSVEMLADLIGRLKDGSGSSGGGGGDRQGTLSHSNSASERGSDTAYKMRSRTQERLGRHGSRGRGTSTGTSAKRMSSRSRSRVPSGYSTGLPPQVTMLPQVKPREPLWYYPQILPFAVETDVSSEAVTTYDSRASGSTSDLNLPVSKYLEMLVDMLNTEKEWELISYTLCHLPVQLANRHFFCGPKSRAVLSRMLNVICTGILGKTLAAGSKRQREALGLAHHTLEVMISYWRCFDLQQRHLMVEVFHAGLNEQPSTVRCCLHALSLAAFELPISTTKYLPRILENLSQIMSNPEMAVHILAYICIIASLPPLYANFTEDDFKTVFGVAVQYLQHHSRHNAPSTMSWALSQHVRLLSYYLIYIWFLAVRLPDRAKHVKFITRQLLIANEGNEAVDGTTEVCFDWLARYTYATADPRPANSLLADIVMNPANESQDVPVKEKTWVVGNAVVTVRALSRLGWLEVLMRRPSGFTKFLCRLENAPMVGPGDVDLDRVSVPAALLMERDPPQVLRSGPDDHEDPLVFTEAAQAEQLKEIFDVREDEGPELPRPDPVMGYVWKGSSPSQRRKEVAVDPSYFAIQVSPYPVFLGPPSLRQRADQAAVPKFVNTIDRIPVIDTHKVGILYVAPGQSNEIEILRNTHGSPAYTRFLEGLGRLISLRGQLDVYAGGLDPDEDGEYAYAWWDDIGQVLYHTATMMPADSSDPQSNNKKRHIGNDYVRIVWNDSGSPYRFDTLSTQFQFVNIVIESHSPGSTAAYSISMYESEYFKVTVQRAPGMTEFVPVGNFKLISGQNLPLLIRQLSLLADRYASVFVQTNRDTTKGDVKTNWQMRLEAIRRFKSNLPIPESPELAIGGIMKEEAFRDFTLAF